MTIRSILWPVGLLALFAAIFFIFVAGGASGAPDLSLDSDDIAFTVDGQVDNSPTVGDKVKMTATIHNIGDTNVTNTFIVEFFDGEKGSGGTQIGTNQLIDRLDAGNSTDVFVNWTASGPGLHTIFVYADWGGATGDTNTSDNEANKTLDVNIAPTANIMVDQTTKQTLTNFNVNATGSNDPDGTIVSHFWNFGDGSFSTTNAAQHAYKDDGVYTISLLITDNDGGTDTDSIQVTVTNRDPTATAANHDVLTYVNVRFDSRNSTDQDGNITNVSWEFHDSTVKYGQRVTFMYYDDGVYNVNLTVKDDDGATDWTIVQVTVRNRVPNAELEANRTRCNRTDYISFNGTGSSDMDGSIVNYTWQFPGGNELYGPEVEYMFDLTNGSYTITLVVTDDDGAIDFATVLIKVGNIQPVAVAGLDTLAKTYEDIIFSGVGSYDPDGIIVNYTWNMGDGGQKIYNKTFKYHYTDDGIYTVRLTVTDDDGASNTSTLKVTISNRAPKAYHPNIVIKTYTDYSFNITHCEDKDGTVQPNTVEWKFMYPGGSSTTKIGNNTKHNWTVAGVYYVQMTIFDDDGASASHTFNVTVINSPPIASFWYTPKIVTTGDFVIFNGTNSTDVDGTVVNWTWDFDDTTVDYGMVVTHAFVNPGDYNVELQVRDNKGGIGIFSVKIHVEPHNDPPFATLSIEGDLETNRPIQFNATGSYDPDGVILQYKWNFGDGTAYGYGLIIMHMYKNAGTYNITLWVTDDGGKTVANKTQITIVESQNMMPFAEIVGGGISVLVDEEVSLDGRGSYDPDGTIVSYEWDFGDGHHGYTAMVRHAYATAQTYTVTLKVTDDRGGIDSETTTIQVQPKPPPNVCPSADFRMTPSSGDIYTGDSLSFDGGLSKDSDGSIVTYTWLFGDGGFAEGKNAQHSYEVDGTYMVTLTVTDDDGCSDSKIQVVIIKNRKPTAVIKPSETRAMSLDEITFSGAESTDQDGYPVKWAWDFGDGTAANGVEVSHVYKRPGSYTVKLIVTDNRGGSSESSVAITIDNRDPVANAGGDQTVVVNTMAKFDGGGSYDPDGTVTEWEWDFGDGSTAVGKYQEHAYADDGNFTVTLYVKDDKGAKSSASTITVSVLPEPKKPKPPKPSGGLPGFELVFLMIALGAAAILARRKE
jgi:PKD repeat protein